MSYCLAYHKQSIEGWYFVVLPLVADHILKDCLVDVSTTDVDS